MFDEAGDLKIHDILTQHTIPINDEWQAYCKDMKGKYDAFIVATCDLIGEARSSTTRRVPPLVVVDMATEDFLFTLEMAHYIRMRASP
eukprot:2352472-Pleurochrysis_carterae.AAC.1